MAPSESDLTDEPSTDEQADEPRTSSLPSKPKSGWFRKSAIIIGGTAVLAGAGYVGYHDISIKQDVADYETRINAVQQVRAGYENQLSTDEDIVAFHENEQANRARLDSLDRVLVTLEKRIDFDNRKDGPLSVEEAAYLDAFLVYSDIQDPLKKEQDLIGRIAETDGQIQSLRAQQQALAATTYIL